MNSYSHHSDGDHMNILCDECRQETGDDDLHGMYEMSYCRNCFVKLCDKMMDRFWVIHEYAPMVTSDLMQMVFGYGMFGPENIEWMRAQIRIREETRLKTYYDQLREEVKSNGTHSEIHDGKEEHQ
jgi:hypothetical protein